MRLKVVTASRQEVLVVEDSSTVEDLVEQLQVQGTTTSNNIKIKSGFPPKEVDISDLSVSLGDVGIRPGDKLIIEEISAPLEKKEVEKKRKSTPDSSTPYIPIADGYVVLRTVPDDNSCLFRSISYAYFHNLEEGSQLRSVVADKIRQDPVTYNDAILGKPVDEYISWILKPTSWGGAIEIQILSDYLNITIHSIDVATGRVDSFNQSAKTFIYLLYSGIHYDTVAYTPLIDIDQKDTDTTTFQMDSDFGIQFAIAVQDLRETLNHKGYVTNTSTFKLKCQICGAIVNGEKGATSHAESTMHTNFGEV